MSIQVFFCDFFSLYKGEKVAQKEKLNKTNGYGHSSLFVLTADDYSF